MFKFVIVSMDGETGRTLVVELMETNNPQEAYEKAEALNRAQYLFGSSGVRFECLQMM